VAICVALLGLSVAFADGGSGSLLAWGLNAEGQLGNNKTPPQPNVPVAVAAGASAPGTTFIQIATGAHHTLALSPTGRLYAWGYNLDGELGNTPSGTPQEADAPVAVSPGASPAGTTFTEVAAGENFSVALSSAGQLYAWGDNTIGQVGNGGSPSEVNTPLAVSAGAIPPGTTITQIAAGGSFALVLSSTGQVYGWGANTNGELGNGLTVGASLTPVAVSAGVIPPGTKIVQIAAGTNHGLALSSTGRVYAWGYNVAGQLGDTPTGSPMSTDTPVAVSPGAMPAGTVITQIAAGTSHSLALSSTGELYAWGLDLEGELGDTPSGSPPQQANVPVAVSPGAIPAGTTIRQIAAGVNFSVALSSTGQVYAWGTNGDGELGNTPTGTPAQANVPVAVSVPAGTTIDKLSSGSQGDHTLVVIGDLAVTTAALPSTTVGLPYSATVAASGGDGGDTWSASGLPAGLSINSASGAITGTPSAAGAATAVVSVTDADGLTASRSLALSVMPFGPASVTVNHRNGAVRFALALTGAGTVSWTLSFPNGAYGVFAARAHRPRCTRTQIKLEGKCRASTISFGSGSQSVAAAGTATFTVTPSRAAAKALKNAFGHHGAVKVTAKITFQTTSAATPITETQTISDKLAAKAKPKHKKP
jgi:alpha-tubulin suppressor-like RCC1 family protein